MLGHGHFELPKKQWKGKESGKLTDC